MPIHRLIGCLLCILAASLSAADDDALRAEIRALREQLQEQRESFEARQSALEQQVHTLEARLTTTTTTTTTTAAAAAPQPVRAPAAADFGGRLLGNTDNMNPEISVIIDTIYANDDTGHDVNEILEDVAGFGHAHGHGHGHAHGFEEGFNLRHLELALAAEVDPWFRGWTIVAVSEDSAELEEAAIETTALPGGFRLRGGKFFSDFGRVNPQHSHAWDFVDQPLVYKFTLGDHGLNDKGVQLSWLAPTPFHLLAGVEAFQGDNELAFQYHGDGPLPEHEGPRVVVGWLKAAPNLGDTHALQVGVFGATGAHQEEHDGNDDGTMDHWLDGDTSFCGADVVYKYDDARAYGVGDFTLQAEYLRRTKDLEVVQHDLVPAFTGRDRIDRQDGYYVQGTYGILPRWRLGMRWEQIGLVNEVELPNLTETDYGSSSRLSAMLDWSLSEFSRLRLQASRGEYELNSGEDEEAWQFFLQWVVSLGSHGAHDF